MSNENPYLTNPLHGTSLNTILNEIVDHYGFPLLYAYLNINCFNKNPSIAASIKFLKKTQWAREKVESFYLYQFKNLPRASDQEFEKPPRERVIPQGIQPKEPAELSFEDAENLRLKRAEKTRKRAEKRTSGKLNPWGNY